MSSLLLNLQAELAARLRQDALFALVAVLCEEERNLNYEVRRQVESLGIACVVMTPVAGVLHPEAAGPQLDQIAIAVRVQESVELNSGPHALEVAERTAWLLHQFQPVSIDAALFAAARTIVRQSDPALLVYDVNFETRDGLAQSTEAL